MLPGCSSGRLAESIGINRPHPEFAVFVEGALANFELLALRVGGRSIAGWNMCLHFELPCQRYSRRTRWRTAMP